MEKVNKEQLKHFYSMTTKSLEKLTEYSGSELRVFKNIYHTFEKSVLNDLFVFKESLKCIIEDIEKLEKDIKEKGIEKESK